MNRFISFCLVAFASLVITGCGASRKAQQEQLNPKPEWITGRPSTGVYYVGIGYSPKSANVSQYQKQAREAALSDLAGEISVSISSKSVLYTFEHKDKVHSDLSSTIRAKVQQDLEGYELVDTWEDQLGYWVYYRLSKSEYHRIKEAKKASALSSATDLFTRGLAFVEQRNTKDALLFTFKSLDAVKAYLTEPLETQVNGKEILLGNEAFSVANQALSNIQITASSSRISAKRGLGVAEDKLTFRVVTLDGKPLQAIPVTASYSERAIRNSKAVSDANGYVSFSIPMVKSAKPQETFKVDIDVNALLSEATNDFLVRKVIFSIPVNSYTLTVDVVRPSVWIASHETNLGEVSRSNTMENALRKRMVTSGLVVATSRESADFILELQGNTVSKGQTNSFYQVALSLVVKLVKQDGTELYVKQITDINGSHLDGERAGQEAYNEAAKRLSSYIFTEIEEAMFK